MSLSYPRKVIPIYLSDPNFYQHHISFKNILTHRIPDKIHFQINCYNRYHINSIHIKFFGIGFLCTYTSVSWSKPSSFLNSYWKITKYLFLPINTLTKPINSLLFHLLNPSLTSSSNPPMFDLIPYLVMIQTMFHTLLIVCIIMRYDRLKYGLKN